MLLADFALAGLPNPAAKPLDLAIQREQGSKVPDGGPTTLYGGTTQRQEECNRMLESRFAKPIVWIAVASLMLVLSGCIVVKDSPAPGCVKSIGFPLAGGCFGKTAILDLAVDPETECLTIAVNNCNGGVLEVHNACDEALVLREVEIPSSDRVSLDVVEGDDGEYRLAEVSSNFSDYVPEADRKVEVAGTLGEQEIRLAFTKTAKLCE